jgi:L-rhamnose-H+ transport protein
MNSILGMLIFAAGGLAGAMFLLPARGIKGWAYESWWMAYLFFGLIVCPPLICSFTVPDFWRVTMSAPWSVLGRCAAFGMMWGIGSLAWGLMVRYLGIGLGLAIGCGLCAATGTLIPPIAAGKAADLVKDTGAIIVLSGVLLLSNFAKILSFIVITIATMDIIAIYGMKIGYLFKSSSNIISWGRSP